MKPKILVTREIFPETCRHTGPAEEEKAACRFGGTVRVNYRGESSGGCSKILQPLRVERLEGWEESNEGLAGDCEEVAS